MSAASAPGIGVQFRPDPPQRGSFPVDHDGECAHLVGDYLKCLKITDGTNAPNCRLLAKKYLECRMMHDLMDKDEMQNLGLAPDQLKPRPISELSYKK